MVDHLALWNAVQETDPNYTKKFSRGGGFRGTSTNAVYLARKATSRWGPIGIGWGVEIIDETVMDGGPLSGGVLTKIHKVRVKLWYVEGDQRGEVIQFGQTTFVGENKNGIFTDEEAPKKSLTDGMTKCLSLLGFSADIFMGLYDDSKYVNDLAEKYANTPDDKPPPQPDADRDARLALAKEKIPTAPDLETLMKYHAAVPDKFPGDTEAWAELNPIFRAGYYRLLPPALDTMSLADCQHWLAWIPKQGYEPTGEKKLTEAIGMRIEELERQETGAPVT